MSSHLLNLYGSNRVAPVDLRFRCLVDAELRSMWSQALRSQSVVSTHGNNGVTWQEKSLFQDRSEKFDLKKREVQAVTGSN